MVVLIVAIVMFASIVKSKHGHSRHLRRHGPEGAIQSGVESRLRDEVTRLKERVAVLERFATDKNQLLDQEIERLRDR